VSDFFNNFKDLITILDIIFIFFIIVNLISGLRNGFVASLISFSKWLIAFYGVKILLPILRPYLDGLIESELITDIILGSVIFFLILFITLLIIKGLKKTIKWSGLGSIDTAFGFIFGILKGYIYFVSIFSILSFVHPYEKWPDYLNNGKSVNIIIWGNDLLLDILPHRYEYIDKGTEKLNKLK
jgi:membrane protein required for colicin V production